MPVATKCEPTIEIRELTFRHTATIRARIKLRALPAELERIYELVMEAIGQQGLAATGSPFARYHRTGPELDLEAGIPLAQPIETQGNVRPSELPAGLCVHVTCQGDDRSLCSVRAIVRDFALRNDLIENGGPWECYRPDSSRAPGSEFWCRAFFQPVKRGDADKRGEPAPIRARSIS